MTAKKKHPKGGKTKKTSSQKHKLTLKQRMLLQKVQKLISDDPIANANPGEVIDTYWIYATRKKGKYPRSNVNSGKWLVFVNLENVDAVWEKIKLATENGLLGEASKVATARPNPNATDVNCKSYLRLFIRLYR